MCVCACVCVCVCVQVSCVLCANTYNRASCSLLTPGTGGTVLASCTGFAVHSWGAGKSRKTGVATGTLRSLGTLQDKGNGSEGRGVGGDGDGKEVEMGMGKRNKDKKLQRVFVTQNEYRRSWYSNDSFISWLSRLSRWTWVT